MTGGEELVVEVPGAQDEVVTGEGVHAVQVARGAGGLHESGGERVVEERAGVGLLVGTGGSDQDRRTGDTDWSALQDTLQIRFSYHSQ
ncbi:hypothetical protein GCM10017774_85420 [Lentzea cavernae]|uniref:Uncharacterized protein n=1 Tax=Lentzea cavernae TaxID=2020703 RepID=A0ABQ3MUW1_9PSEU|nr:hypothetical protein GCM10017774_85420 [Lentzea cavernae]